MFKTSCRFTSHLWEFTPNRRFSPPAAPPHFEIKLRNQTTRLGDPAVLLCEARGEEPITIKWIQNGVPLNAREPSPRYTIRQQKTDGGATSDLSLQETSRRDSATYTCLASNPFGQDNTTINLIVQGEATGWRGGSS